MAPSLPPRPPPPFVEALAIIAEREDEDAAGWSPAKRRAALVWYVLGTVECPQAEVDRRLAMALQWLQQPEYTKAYHAYGQGLCTAAANAAIIRAVLTRPGGWEAHFGEIARLLKPQPREAQGLLPPRRLDFGAQLQ